VKPGMVFQLAILVLTWVLVYLGIYRGGQGIMPKVRRIAGLDAIEEAVGRATETNKAVYITPGSGGLSDDSAIQTLAGLAIMEHTVKICARYKAPFWVSMRQAQVFPLADEMVRSALASEAAMDLYKTDTVEYLSEEQFAFAMGTLGRMQRQGVAAAVLVGFFQAESLLLAEGAAQQGAITIGGCSREVQIPFFVVACDYTLIGEELMVGGAYLSKNAVQLGGLWGQDGMKIVGIAFVVLGVLAKMVNSKILDDLFKM